MHLGALADEELISLVRTRNELIVTDIEQELARRLAAALDKIERLEDEASNMEDEE